LSENSYDFQPGKVIHGCPGKWLTAQNEGELPVAFFTLYYHYDGATTGYMHCPYEMEIGMNPRLFSMLRQLVELWDKPNAQPTLQVKTLVYSVLSEMFSSAQSIQQTNANSIVEDAKAYVERHYMEQHSLCELGGRYGMRGKYFSDVFKKYTGISPIDYLIAFRMRQARNLIEQTECNIKDIGKSVGYKDVKSFSRQFRKDFGISPNGLREQISSDQIRKSAP
jgi:YesN/AraC family two-component response regulator